MFYQFLIVITAAAKICVCTRPWLIVHEKRLIPPCLAQKTSAFWRFRSKSWENLIPVLVESITVSEHIRQDIFYPCIHFLFFTAYLHLLFLSCILSFSLVYLHNLMI